VDANFEHGGQVVDQLNHAEFRTDCAVSWSAARAALGAHYYHSCVVVAKLDQLTDLEQIDERRRAVPRVSMTVLSDRQPEQPHDLVLRQGVDALLSTPFSMHDLTSQLAAFSLRARSTSWPWRTV
jgi:DNA-binding response OmpR family regulator